MRLFGTPRRLGVLVAALALVSALCAAAAQAWSTCPQFNPGTQFGPTTFTFSTTDSGTLGALCPTTAQDPSNAVCGHQEFAVSAVPGTLNATVSYPSAGGFNLITLTLCEENQPTPAAVGNCPITSSDGTNADVEITCTTSSTDDGTTQTQSITCPITSAGTYELLVVPNSVFSCDPTDTTNCPDGGITGSVPATLTGNYQPNLPTAQSDGGTVWGAGQVAPSEYFGLYAVNDSNRWSKAGLVFANTASGLTKCKFKANGATLVSIQPGSGWSSGGTAELQGTGTVTNFLGVKTQVSYTLKVTDGGWTGRTRNPDTFQLSALGCDTNGIALPVTKGHIDIDPDRDWR